MNQANPRLGYMFAALNAVISGVAIFVNTYGVKLFTDSTLYTAMKNGVVGVVLLVPVIFFGTQRTELKRLRTRQWGLLVLLAIVGGSLPYVLTFRGFQLSTPTTNALVSHVNFVFVAILAAVFLRERVGWLVWIALALLLVGTSWGLNLQAIRLNEAAWLILASTAFFAIASIMMKSMLKELSPALIMAAKMSLGSLFIFGYVGASGHLDQIGHLNGQQWLFVLVTGLILTAFTVTAVLALNYCSATAATAIPAAAPLITTMLVVLSTQSLKLPRTTLIGLGIMLGATLAVVLFGLLHESHQSHQSKQERQKSAVTKGTVMV
jgi:drug/metabolite transporter (DMT)-like permease